MLVYDLPNMRMYHFSYSLQTFSSRYFLIFFASSGQAQSQDSLERGQCSSNISHSHSNSEREQRKQNITQRTDKTICEFDRSNNIHQLTSFIDDRS